MRIEKDFYFEMKKDDSVDINQKVSFVKSKNRNRFYSEELINALTEEVINEIRTI